jgi:hypothetical protein
MDQPGDAGCGHARGPGNGLGNPTEGRTPCLDVAAGGHLSRSTAPTPPARSHYTSLARVAGRRWAVEESFQAGKELAGLDEHQVRRWTSWHRWTVLAMLAHAFLAVTAATERARAAPPAGLIPLTPNEIRRLFIGLLTRPVRDATHLLHWSRWRRHHQAAARASHYRRQDRQLE